MKRFPNDKIRKETDAERAEGLRILSEIESNDQSESRHGLRGKAWF
jgi:hypothetical protein